MSNYPSVVSRTMTCPRCNATATLSYASYPGESRAQQFVYLCPNQCTLPHDELVMLVDRRT